MMESIRIPPKLEQFIVCQSVIQHPDGQLAPIEPYTDVTLELEKPPDWQPGELLKVPWQFAFYVQWSGGLGPFTTLIEMIQPNQSTVRMVIGNLRAAGEGKATIWAPTPQVQLTQSGLHRLRLWQNNRPLAETSVWFRLDGLA
ncbi:MAG: hypothetical protein NTZ05_20640 [Chloroflexi bacterium]|nr:hypothetical protein [Chloroflexota bacterium]